MSCVDIIISHLAPDFSHFYWHYWYIRRTRIFPVSFNSPCMDSSLSECVSCFGRVGCSAIAIWYFSQLKLVRKFQLKKNWYLTLLFPFKLKVTPVGCKFPVVKFKNTSISVSLEEMRWLLNKINMPLSIDWIFLYLVENTQKSSQWDEWMEQRLCYMQNGSERVRTRDKKLINRERREDFYLIQ